jgi:hypothetical protein
MLYKEPPVVLAHEALNSDKPHDKLTKLQLINHKISQQESMLKILARFS